MKLIKDILPQFPITGSFIQPSDSPILDFSCEKPVNKAIKKARMSVIRAFWGFLFVKHQISQLFRAHLQNHCC